MTSTRHSGRSPMSMVSSLSRECSDQAGGLEGMWVPSAPIVVRWLRSESGLKMDTACHVISRRHHPRKRMIQYSAADAMERQVRGVLDTPAFAGYDGAGAACFPALLAPNRDREIGGGRATRQPGQVRKEAALTRSGSGRSSVSYLFFRANRAGNGQAPRLVLDFTPSASRP